MLELAPVTGWVVRAEHAARVVTPPYDALTASQREQLAATDPDSYLGALPPTTTAVGPAYGPRLRRCRDHLDVLLAGDRFTRLDDPALLVLAIGSGHGSSVGVVGDLDVEVFRDGTVRPHEATRADRVRQLARYLEVVGVASSPVAVTQRTTRAFAAATAAVRRRGPDLTVTDDDRGEHLRVWVVTDHGQASDLTGAVAAAGAGYIADGHHRAAAVAEFAHTHRLGGDHPGRQVLTAVFGEDDLTVTPFHRVVDLDAHPGAAAGLRDGDLSALTTAGFQVRPLDPAVDPEPWRTVPAGSWHVCAEGRWWHLERPADDLTGPATDGRWPASPTPDEAPVRGLDVVRLEEVLGALGVPTEAATPVAPARSQALVGPGRLGIALHPPSWAQVRAVADAGRTLPAKTTYLTPKLRSGLMVVPRPRATS